MFDHLHKNQENLFKSNMKSIYGEEDLEKSELIDSAADFLEKGKKANLGEVREWNGRKYQKTTQGWKPAGKATNSKENGGKVEDKKEESEKKITMNNLDWGKSTEERNANLDKYESLKTDKEKEEFKRKLKS